MNIKKIALFIIILALFVQCNNEKDTTFLITENSVGKLQKTTSVKDLEAIYALDSIVKDTFNVGFGSNAQKLNIYEKGGKHLLTLTPNRDSVPTIQNIRIYDPRFVTEKGIGINSTFKEISTQYQIKKIMTLMNSVIISLKGTNAYFTIDRKELPANIRYNKSDIDAVQIPDAAKAKYMMVGWD